MITNDLRGQPGELRMTVQVMRKETGKVETYELMGRATPEQDAALKEITKEVPDGGNA